MATALIRKLNRFIDLSEEEKGALAGICTDMRDVRAGTDLIREGDHPDKVFILLDGWAYRYKILADGKRQILAFLIPGDLCDIHIFILARMDHSIATLGAARIATIPPERLIEVMDRHRNIERALWWATLVDEAVLREWLVNMGQRDAYHRIAHLFCELWLRMQAVELTGKGSISLPITQTELADAMGLTPVHVNRTLQRLRAEGLITLDARQLTIPDPARLAAISGFEPNYLHLDRDRGANSAIGRPTRSSAP